MNNTVRIKQADVTLLTYPLSMTSVSLKQKNIDLDYYNQRAEPDGPAMTAAIAAAAKNRIATSGCSSSIYYSQATVPFLRAPWYQMSEQANDDMNGNGGIAPAFPFLTAHGGALQIPHFGMLGVSLNNETLHIRPSLPMPFTNLQLADFYFAGNRLRATMNSTHTNLTRLPNTRVSGLIDIYQNQTMPIVVESRNAESTDLDTETYFLLMNETLTMENGLYWKHLATPGNILQCQPTITEASNILGQYPGAINDGDTGTHFQPGHRNRTALIIDTSKSTFKKLDGFRIDWGARPATNITVTIANSTNTDPNSSNKTFKVDVQPNVIYGQHASMSEVVPYTGNFTFYDFPDNGLDVWSGNYSILEFEGCKECGLVGGVEDTMGATVAEFELIAMVKNKVQDEDEMVKGLEDQNAASRQGSGDVGTVEGGGV